MYLPAFDSPAQYFKAIYSSINLHPSFLGLLPALLSRANNCYRIQVNKRVSYCYVLIWADISASFLEKAKSRVIKSICIAERKFSKARTL